MKRAARPRVAVLHGREWPGGIRQLIDLILASGPGVLRNECDMVYYPGDFLIGLNVPHAELGQKVREWLILELFREGRISGGKAAGTGGLK